MKQRWLNTSPRRKSEHKRGNRSRGSEQILDYFYAVIVHICYNINSCHGKVGREGEKIIGERGNCVNA